MHQKNQLPLLNDIKTTNLGGTSCTTHSFDQPPVLGSHHSHAYICRDEHPNTSCDLLFSHEDSNSDQECASVKEDVHTKTSSSPHLPMCPTTHNASTRVRDTPRSLVSSSNYLYPQFTQGSEVFRDEVENSLIIECSFDSPPSLLLHEDNSSNQLVEVEKYGETCDRDGCHLESSFEINKNNHTQAMHDLVHASKCDFVILERFETCQGVEALHRPLMVMLGPRNSDKPLEPNQIWLLMQNPSIDMVSLSVDPHVKKCLVFQE